MPMPYPYLLRTSWSRPLILTARSALVLWALALWVLPASSSFAQKPQLTPAKVNQIKKTRKSFEYCRKDALSQLKQGAVSQKKFEVMLNTCKENFPGASLYIECKRSAIRQARAHSTSPNQAIDQCKRYLTAASFDPQDVMPLFVDKGQAFFAGIGLNRITPVANLNPPNFDCSKLANVARKPAEAQYLLFGNHPRSFAGLADKKGPALLKALNMNKTAKAGIDIPGFGRVFGSPANSSGMAFFPSASCDFDADLGDVFAGLSIHYLLDAPSNTATPYFGIGYYRQDQKSTTTRKLVQSIIKTLGSNFKPLKKSPTVTFITAAKVAETDDEKDPKNLCLPPRQHRFIAVVQSRRDAPTSPEYMLLANVKNLCDFGDKLSKRLTR